MAHNRAERVKYNFISNVINKVTVLIFPFIIRTVLIQKLGAEYLGLGSLFTSILQVLNMAEIGFSSAIVYSMYKPIAENKVDEICALLRFYKKAYRIIGITILTVGMVVLPFVPRLIKDSYPADINIYVLYLFFLTDTVVSYLFSAYKTSLLIASQRQDIISAVDTVIVLSRSLVQLILLIIVPDYYIYVICNIIFTLINNIAIARVTSKRFPFYVCRGEIEKSKKSAIIQQVKGLAIGKVTKVSRNSFDSIVLSMYCGLIDLAIYSNYYCIFTAVINVIAILVNSLTASVGNSVAVESREKNYNDFKCFNYFFAWLGGWCTICMFCLYQPFMALWMGKELVASDSTMILFCIYFYITQMGQARALYSAAAGLWWELRYLQVAEMLLNLILNFLLGYFWGMNGILAATIITVFFFSIIGITRMTYKIYFRKSFIEYCWAIGKYAFVTVVGLIITNSICSIVTLKGISEVLVKACICIFVPNAFFLILSLVNKQHFGYLSKMFKLCCSVSK